MVGFHPAGEELNRHENRPAVATRWAFVFLPVWGPGACGPWWGAGVESLPLAGVQGTARARRWGRSCGGPVLLDRSGLQAVQIVRGALRMGGGRPSSHRFTRRAPADATFGCEEAKSTGVKMADLTVRTHKVPTGSYPKLTLIACPLIAGKPRVVMRRRL